MSFCRWSSDDFTSDLYIYEDVRGGFTTHVAGNRIVYTEPLPEPINLVEDPEGWVKRNKVVMEIIDRSEREAVGGPCDGETYSDATADECADRVLRLGAMGYRYPAGLVEELRAAATE